MGFRPIAGKPGALFVEEFGVTVEVEDILRMVSAGLCSQTSAREMVMDRARTRGAALGTKIGGSYTPSAIRLAETMGGFVATAKDGAEAMKAVQTSIEGVKIALETKPIEAEQERSRALAVAEEMLDQKQDESKGD